ncbi:MAG: hypothetical protein HYU98_06355, partial [Deltaproteobacteria bacterium]|nr:hypothetical protein [Deltaproteobacteria bacterium]
MWFPPDFPSQKTASELNDEELIFLIKWIAKKLYVIPPQKNEFTKQGVKESFERSNLTGDYNDLDKWHEEAKIIKWKSYPWGGLPLDENDSFYPHVIIERNIEDMDIDLRLWNGFKAIRLYLQNNMDCRSVLFWPHDGAGSFMPFANGKELILRQQRGYVLFSQAIVLGFEQDHPAAKIAGELLDMRKRIEGVPVYSKSLFKYNGGDKRKIEHEVFHGVLFCRFEDSGAPISTADKLKLNYIA